MKNILLSVVLTLAGFGLTCSKAQAATVKLTWTNTYDDNGDVASGPVKGWQVRASTSGAITNANWGAAEIVAETNQILATIGGQPDSTTIGGLLPNTTYWFAVKAYDEASNWSDVSNPCSVTTPDIVRPASVVDMACEVK